VKDETFVKNQEKGISTRYSLWNTTSKAMLAVQGEKTIECVEVFVDWLKITAA